MTTGEMRRLLDARRRAREQEARDVAAFAARTQAQQDEQEAKNAAAAADERALQARISANPMSDSEEPVANTGNWLDHNGNRI